MTFNKFALLAAAAAGAFGASAQAQQAFPAATLNGAGATLPANVTRQILDCYGIKEDLAFTGSAPLVTIFDFNYATTTAATLGNRFNCAGNAAAPPIAAGPAGSPQFSNPRIIQPNIKARYQGTGSGAGVQSWLFHQAPNSYPGTTTTLPAGWAPYGNAGVQFGVSESALTFANLNDANTGYNNRVLTSPDNNGAALPNGTAAARYGAAIQIPMYVVPVALAYSPTYAQVRNADNSLTSYNFTIGGARADGSGGLKLTRSQYCGILNGVLINWNQLPTGIINKDPADPAAFNVPIQLVGRKDSSGTTTLFTRAMAAQCNNVTVNTGLGGVGSPFTIGGPTDPNPNKYVNATGTLPSALRVGNAEFVKGTSPSITGAVTPGNFMVSDGNDGVAQAVDYLVPPANGTFGTPAGRVQNGKIGYGGTDAFLPATLFTLANNYGLNTASLQKGTTTSFLPPSSANATAAFGAVRPPQSLGTGGAYCVSGGGACNTNTVNPNGIGDRANPLDWVAPGNRFLVDTSTGAVTTTPNPIAIPSVGYPIVGTSNVLLYTCYFSTALRTATNGLWATYLGATTKDYNNQTFPAALIWNATLGIQTKNGVAALPTGWRNAIRETFFKASTQASGGGTLGGRNLWIQSRIPTLPSTASTTNNSLQNSTSNPTCVGKPGA